MFFFVIAILAVWPVVAGFVAFVTAIVVAFDREWRSACLENALISGSAGVIYIVLMIQITTGDFNQCILPFLPGTLAIVMWAIVTIGIVSLIRDFLTKDPVLG